MSTALKDLRAIQAIRKRYKAGEITLEQATLEGRPTLRSIHARATAFASKQGAKPKLVTFVELMA